MKNLLILAIINLYTLQTFGQLSRLELYGGLNLTNPTVLRNSFTGIDPGLGYVIGGLYRYKDNPHPPISFQFGLGFTQRTYNVHITTNRDNGPLGEIFSKNYLRDIEIPLFGGYTMDLNNYQVVFKIGLIPGFNILYRSDLKFNNIVDPEGNLETWEEMRTLRPNKFERLNAFTGISLARKFNGYHLGFQPNLQYNFLPLIRKDSIGAEFWSYGINLIISK